MEDILNCDPKNVKDAVPEGWRLVIVSSKPPQYRLFSPYWEGYVKLTAAQYISAAKVQEQALIQKSVWLD